MKVAILFWFSLALLAQAAGLEFDTLLKEIHAPPDAATVTAEFNFTNSSDKPVAITNSDSGCSCVGVEISGGKLKYAPGESGALKATFTLGNISGTVDKVIALWIDKDPPEKPSMSLTVRVHIPVLIALEPKTVKWDLNGKAHPQTIQIRVAEGEAIRVVGVKSSSAAFSCDLNTLEEGKKYDLVINPTAIGSAGLAVIQIQTDSKNPKYRTQQVFAIVSKSPQAQTEDKP